MKKTVMLLVASALLVGLWSNVALAEQGIFTKVYVKDMPSAESVAVTNGGVCVKSATDKPPMLLFEYETRKCAPNSGHVSAKFGWLRQELVIGDKTLPIATTRVLTANMTVDENGNEVEMPFEDGSGQFYMVECRGISSNATNEQTAAILAKENKKMAEWMENKMAEVKSSITNDGAETRRAVAIVGDQVTEVGEKVSENNEYLYVSAYNAEIDQQVAERRMSCMMEVIESNNDLIDQQQSANTENERIRGKNRKSREMRENLDLLAKGLKYYAAKDGKIGDDTAAEIELGQAVGNKILAGTERDQIIINGAPDPGARCLAISASSMGLAYKPYPFATQMASK